MDTQSIRSEKAFVLPTVLMMMGLLLTLLAAYWTLTRVETASVHYANTDVSSFYAAEAGLKFLLAVGTPAIERRNYALTRRCMQRLDEIGWPSITPTQDERRGATVAVPSRDSGGLSKELMRRDIVTSHRDDNVRASFHFYNDDDDVESFIAAMKDLRGSFSPR